ncbi:hypothetical protein RN001_006614 [Aquatica leii]|uniref:ditrans,polycis-polyprenyl diphosphate synthase [(2E,6E)-farnesyldiphosphate specific] n=1 Tax=Aquatica leii TaxID=1421715 RepID=A0AAN7Q8Z2_9COLE|nr:hypothetical protein RN001_006614 [Aquatica leii]
MFLNLFSYKTAYVVVHTLYEYFEFFYYTFLYYYQILLNIYHKYTKIQDRQFIAENVKIIKRIPIHVSIILANEEPSYNDLAKLVTWCVTSGITYISFYDHKGVLKKSQEKLQKAIEAKKCSDTYIIWYNGEHGYKNGFVGRKVYLRTFSLSDSRETIVNTAKRLCQGNVKEINLETVNKNLKDKYVFPDPELCLYCGNVFTLYGYPPWEVRLTEFIGIGTHHNINPRTFVRALYRFSKTEMRLGK